MKMQKITIAKGIAGDKIGYIPFAAEPKAAYLIRETGRCFFILLDYGDNQFWLDEPKSAVFCGDVQLKDEYGTLIKPVCKLQ